VAVGAGDGPDQGQDPRADGPQAGEAAAVENVNHAVRGWGNYFRYGNSGAKFSAIDSYVNERLAILASAKHGLRGRNWVSRFNYEWTTQMGVYGLSGKVRSTRAFAGGERCR
jgi:RNA-directed DNA polymerase